MPSIWWRASSRSNLTAMPRKPPGFQDCSACKAHSANSTARSPIASPRARLICERLASPIICGRPRWPSSRSISRTMRRTRGSWVGSSGASHQPPSFRDAPLGAGPESILPVVVMDSGLATSSRPGMTVPLPPHPLRRTLLRECLRPLNIILRRRHRLHRGVLALFGHRLFQRDREAFLNRLLGGADRHRAVLADGLRPAFGGDKRFAWRHHLVDEAEFVAFLGGDVARGEDHAHGALQTDLARQAVQSAGERGEADVRFGQCEPRILGGNDEIAGQRNLEAAAHRNAVDGGDDRLVAVETRSQPGESAGVPAALAAGGLPFQIVAGAERLVPGAGDDRYPLLRIGGKVVEYLVQFEMRVDMQRVINFGPRQRHDRDRSLARDLGEFQVHVGSRCFFCGEEFMAWILAWPRLPIPSNYARRPRVTSHIPLLDLMRGSHLNRW